MANEKATKQGAHHAISSHCYADADNDGNKRQLAQL